MATFFSDENGAPSRPMSGLDPVLKGTSPSSTWSEHSYFKGLHNYQWNDPAKPSQRPFSYDEYPRSITKSRPITVLSEKMFSIRPEDEDKADVPRPSRPRLFGGYRSMYGSVPYDEKLLAERDAESDDEYDDYPTGWRRIALLVCALVPYCIVSRHLTPAHYSRS